MYEEVVMHRNPRHIDDWFVYWMVWKFGEKLYPGVRKARIKLVEAASAPPDGRSVEEWERKSFVIDTWGSWNDGHTLSLKLQEVVSSATIMAHRLHIERDPNLVRMLKFVSGNDCRGGSTPFDLASITKILSDYFGFQGRMAAKHNRQFSAEEQAVQLRGILFQIFDAFYSQEINFNRALQEIKESRTVRWTTVECADKKKRLVVVVRTSNDQMHRALRSLRPRPDIIIHQNRRGQVTIFAEGSLPLDEIHQAVIAQEIALGRSSAEAEEMWCLFQRSTANKLMNGGLSAPNKPATRVSVWFIQKLVCEKLREYSAAFSRVVEEVVGNSINY